MSIKEQENKPIKHKTHKVKSNVSETQVKPVSYLANQVTNHTLQRLLTQRSSDASTDLDDDTAGRINQARGRGQSLDTTLQMQMSQAMGHDFSGVLVHTSNESDALNQQLSARAFTTGQDIFFRGGEYNPGSSGGRELIAHELTHVVQQSSGAVGGGSDRMTVNPPDDVYEQEADAVAKQVGGMDLSAAGGGDSVQRQEMPEDEELQMKAIQRQEGVEEEELQTKSLQRQAAPEEEELQTKTVQREEMPEEEMGE